MNPTFRSYAVGSPEREWLTRNAAAGDRTAQFVCGGFFEGEGNFKRAAVWYRRASSQGHAWAHLGLARALVKQSSGSIEAEERLRQEGNAALDRAIAVKDFESDGVLRSFVARGWREERV